MNPAAESLVLVRDPIPGQTRTITVIVITKAQAAHLPDLPADAPSVTIEIEADHS